MSPAPPLHNLMHNLAETFHFLSLVVDYKVAPRGIVYAGAFTGEHIPIFLTIGFERVLAIEPNPAAFAQLSKLASDRVRCVHGALSASEGSASLYDVEGVPTLNSLLEPDLPAIFAHLGRRPPSLDRIAVKTFALDDILGGLPEETYNVLYMNIQGGELNALLGASGSLSGLQAIVTEVNFVPRYRGCPTFDVLDRHLEERGFRMMRLRKYGWSGGEHGEAFYLSHAHLDANKPCRAATPGA
jgi:FkbM family methyltransferase